MPHFCRVLLLCLGFLSLQLSLVSGGDRCPVVNLFAGSGTNASAASMSAMDIGGMAMAGMDMSSVDDGDSASPDPQSGHDEQPCDTHDERTTCDSMTVCTFAAVIAGRPTQHAPRMPAAAAPVLAMQMPASERSAPDHPPPKLMS